MKDYIEPELTILILDFLKEEATRDCIYSVNRHIKVPHKIHYYHNGHCEYAHDLYNEGLVDRLIQSRVNEGLGIGTRDLVASCFSPYFMMLQNDQVIGRDFTEDEFEAIQSKLRETRPSERPLSVRTDLTYTVDGVPGEDSSETKVIETRERIYGSVGLAGSVGGGGVYSERCHIMPTVLYKRLEYVLSAGGAGPYSHLPWREGQIQEYYKMRGWTHLTDWPPLVVDRGVWTIRTNPDTSLLHMRTDTKALWWERKPTESYVFPELTEAEWAASIAGQWVNGTVPETYLKKGQSFNCWGDVKDPLKDYPRDA
jgi:hypothetical protein